MEFFHKICNPNLKNLDHAVHGGNISKKYSKNLDKWKEILDFSTNINPIGPSKNVLTAIENNLWQIAYYPESSSLLLREEVSNFFGNKISPESLIICAGLTELINLTAEVFIQPNSKVLIPVPTYEDYKWAVNKFGGKTKFLNLQSQDNFRMDSIIEYITPDISSIYICNPNNPTARLENSKLMIEIVELANNNNILVFVDESFIDYCDPKSSLIFQIQNYPNLIIFRSFTKFFALTGLRIGYGISNENIIELLMKGKLPWNVNCLAQVAAIYAIRDQIFIRNSRENINKERNYLINSLKNIAGIKVFPSDTGFILFQLKSNIDPNKFEEKLLENKILIRNCSSFQGLDDTYYRIGIKLRKDNEKLIKILKKLLK